MRDPASLMNRAATVLQAAKFGHISERTKRDYQQISERLIAERKSVGEAWAARQRWPTEIMQPSAVLHGRAGLFMKSLRPFGIYGNAG